MHSSPKMKLSGKVLWAIVVLLIATSWFGNIWYYNSAQLEKPFFFKHYIVLNGYDNNRIVLSYLENKKKGKKVTGIQLEELPMLRFQIDSHSATYNHQVLVKAYGQWSTGDEQSMDTVPVTIKEATVYYSEGPPEKVPIGEINVIWEQRDNLLETSFSSSSSDGTGQYGVIAKQPFMLEQVDYSFRDRLSSIFELTMENRDKPFPMPIYAGDQLTFTYKWTIQENSTAAFEVYQAYIMLTMKTEDGRTTYDRYPISFNVHLDEKQIKRLVHSGGELY